MVDIKINQGGLLKSVSSRKKALDSVADYNTKEKKKKPTVATKLMGLFLSDKKMKAREERKKKREETKNKLKALSERKTVFDPLKGMSKERYEMMDGITDSLRPGGKYYVGDEVPHKTSMKRRTKN